MRLNIVPDEPHDFYLLLEALQYKNQWHGNSQKVIRAFKNITCLDFQQKVITARICHTDRGEAGNGYRAMILPGDSRLEKIKMATLIHELSHRLLGGNALGLTALGIIEPTGKWTHRHTEIEHRHIYLFEYDVMASLGEYWQASCLEYEQSPFQKNPEAAYQVAWGWAMGLSFEQRQKALKWLTSKKITRENWKDDWDSQPKIDVDDWIKELEGHAQS